MSIATVPAAAGLFFVQKNYFLYLSNMDEERILTLFPGKSDPSNSYLWLPAWMHLKDTAAVMENLVREWLPQHTINLIEAQIDEGNLINYAKLLGNLHDIGKVTPGFFCRELIKKSGIHRTKWK